MKGDYQAFRGHGGSRASETALRANQYGLERQKQERAAQMRNTALIMMMSDTCQLFGIAVSVTDRCVSDARALCRCNAEVAKIGEKRSSVRKWHENIEQSTRRSPQHPPESNKFF